MIDTIKTKSEVLGESIDLKVILPNDKPIRTLMILLHGNMNLESSMQLLEKFSLELNLEELCEKYYMAVVTPLMKNRYYISTADYDCEEYIARELPVYMKKKYNISDSVELILAGVSMGGFGAALIAARTGVFQKIVSISGAYIANDVAIGNPEVWGNLNPRCKELEKSFLYYFLPLEDLENSARRNALAALSLFKERGEAPVFVITCGTEDWLYSRNIQFIEELCRQDINYCFFSLEDGSHESDCFAKGLWAAIEYLSNCKCASDIERENMCR